MRSDPGADALQHRRVVRSFVRREGRITPAQEHALARLWPRFGIGPLDAVEAQARLAPIDPQALYGRCAPLVVEIGFGNGEHLGAQARARADADFLGIEVHRPGVGRLLLEAERLELCNLRVACADAVCVLRDALAPGSVDEVAILFPDPWPKKRHHKRRLIQPEFTQLLARVLRPGGRLRLATDWDDYARHMLAVLAAHPELSNAAAAGDFAQRPPERPLTRFEQRGVRLGHAVFDLEFRRR
jgi:tRNA (guanine-N7-)-methyltransferase